MTAAKTLEVYENNADEYARCLDGEETPGLASFIQDLPKNAHVLDLGCGPGVQAQRFISAGHVVDAVDGAKAMVELAKQNGVWARYGLFEQLDERDAYDGIWANFSLLHLEKTRFSKMMATLKRAIKPDGLLHLAMKLGTGEAYDRLGRFYAYYETQELDDILSKSGFRTTLHQFGSGVGLEGSTSDWIIVRANG